MIAPCPACARQVSDRARACPFCGAALVPPAAVVPAAAPAVPGPAGPPAAGDAGGGPVTFWPHAPPWPAAPGPPPWAGGNPSGVAGGSVAGSDTHGIWAFVLALGAACVPFVWPVSLGLAISQLARGQRGRGGGAGKWLAVAALVIDFSAIPVLAAIALPNFFKYQARSKSGEARLLLAELASAEQRYYEAHGEYLAFRQLPDGPPGSTKVKAPPPGPELQALGVDLRDSGNLYYRYAAAFSGRSPDELVITAVGDLDGDGQRSSFSITLDRGATGTLQESDALE